MKNKNKTVDDKNTISFIEKYLNLKSTPNLNKQSNQLWYELENDYSKTNKKRIFFYIRKMQYDIFLKTLYWYIISEHIKINNNNKCEFGIEHDNTYLNVHHSTYSIHGKEITNMKYLKCLCFNCHQKLHGYNNNLKSVNDNDFMLSILDYKASMLINTMEYEIRPEYVLNKMKKIINSFNENKLFLMVRKEH